HFQVEFGDLQWNRRDWSRDEVWMTFDPRYQRVEDLETMQIDDTQQMIGEGRIKRSFLDQIIDREHSYDPRVMGQRTVFIGLSLILTAALSLVALTVVLSMASAARMGEERRSERKPDSIRYGLQLIPDLHQLSNGMLVYSTSLDANATRQKYVDGINEFLDTYVNEQNSRHRFMADCAEGQTEKPKDKWCRFDTTRAFSREGRGCTRYDNFGYDSGAPCVLFALKDEIQWRPKVGSNVTEVPFKCDITPNARSSSPPGAIYFPALRDNLRLGGFPINKLPSRNLIVNGEPVTDEDGETAYDTPSLIFVKFALPDVKMHYTISCGLKDDVEGYEIKNLNDFRGRKIFTFDVIVN
ncbi:hypothetical protein PRIPAC_71505, partial [Pristionchus pacificus]